MVEFCYLQYKRKASRKTLAADPSESRRVSQLPEGALVGSGTGRGHAGHFIGETQCMQYHLS